MEIKVNDKIKTTYGSIYTVMSVNENIITVYETNNKIHKNNVIKVN